jgi:hypothetical protein
MNLATGTTKQLNAIAQSLEARIVELPTIAAAASLNQAYQVALSDTQNGQR